MRDCVIATVFALTIGASAAPTDWSRFRGPNGTGVSDTTGLPGEFNPTTNGIWKAGRRELWRREVPRTVKGRLDGPNGPASPSPVTDGDRVYAFFQDFGFIAFSADGKEQWRLPLGPFNIFYGFWAGPTPVRGFCLSPV